MNLIGISGTNGAGKDTVGHIIADRFGFLFISMTDMLRDDLVRRQLPPSRPNMRELSAAWRRESGLGMLVDKALEGYKRDPKNYRGLCVASLRNPGEADRVHELGGKIVWVDAAPQIRYSRIQNNIASRGAHRAVDDDKSYEQFLAEEQHEMQHSGDAATLSLSEVKQRADVFIENDGDDAQKLADIIAEKLNLS